MFLFIYFFKLQIWIVESAAALIEISVAVMTWVCPVATLETHLTEEWVSNLNLCSYKFLRWLHNVNLLNNFFFFFN